MRRHLGSARFTDPVKLSHSAWRRANTASPTSKRVAGSPRRRAVQRRPGMGGDPTGRTPPWTRRFATVYTVRMLRLLPTSPKFFDLFERQAAIVLEGARALKELAQNFDQDRKSVV